MAAMIHIPGPTTITTSVGGELGKARDGCTVRVHQHQRAVMTDDSGDVPEEIIYRGLIAEVVVPLIKYTEVNVQSFLKMGGTFGTQLIIGTAMMTLAGTLTITPTKTGEKTYVFNKVLPGTSFEISPLGALEKLYFLVIMCYPDVNGVVFVSSG